eukprot:10299553-Prorocentrum_lima.AAC.1
MMMTKGDASKVIPVSASVGRRHVSASPIVKHNANMRANVSQQPRNSSRTRRPIDIATASTESRQ